MLQLPAERVGPYVRALRAALNALAPNEDHVPLSAALDHLHALDPALSGRLLFPAEVSPHSGMPAYPWLERARSEATLAARGSEATDPTDDHLERAMGLDPDLGGRMRDRRALHRHLRTAELLAATRLGGAVRRVHPSGATQVALAYDRMGPDGRWVRIRMELSTPGPPTGALRLDRKGRLVIDESVQHLLTRHFPIQLMALRAHLQESLGAQVVRLGRSWLGPFWFPGVALPTGVPPELGSGLLLHASTEVVAEDVHESRHLDPWEPAPPEEVVPEGHGTYRDRRFAASTEVVAEAVRTWCAEGGVRPQVIVLQRPRAQRRL